VEDLVDPDGKITARLNHSGKLRTGPQYNNKETTRSHLDGEITGRPETLRLA